MWFFAAVLILWGSTYELGRLDAWVLTPVTLWAWWTFNLYVCSAAASYCRFSSLAEKLMGLFGFCLVVVYYQAMSVSYMEFLPTDPGSPDLWPTIFLTVNLLGPLILITAGLASQAVQTSRD